MKNKCFNVRACKVLALFLILIFTKSCILPVAVLNRTEYDIVIACKKYRPQQVIEQNECLHVEIPSKTNITITDAGGKKLGSIDVEGHDMVIVDDNGVRINNSRAWDWSKRCTTNNYWFPSLYPVKTVDNSYCNPQAY